MNKPKQSNKNDAKKALLKKIIGGKGGKGKPSRLGASPIKMDGGLGNAPISGTAASGGGGSNLGINGIY